MNAIVDQIHALPEEEQLETLEAILGGITLGTAVKLVPRLEESWGVEAQPQTSQAPPSKEDEEAEVVKTAFDVLVTEIADKKIQVIKAVRAATQLPLKDAKALLDAGLPATVKKDLSREDAENLKKNLEESGAVVAIQ